MNLLCNLLKARLVRDLTTMQVSSKVLLMRKATLSALNNITSFYHYYYYHSSSTPPPPHPTPNSTEGDGKSPIHFRFSVWDNVN